MTGPRRRLPGWLIVAAVLTRGVPAVLALAMHGDSSAFVSTDSYEYLALASSLAWSGRFARDGIPEIHRTPLFPLFLVPGTWLGSPVLIALVLQIAAAVLVTVLVFETARTLTGSPRTATFAAVIYLLEPGQPIWSSMLLADALLTAIVGLLMWVAVRYQPAGRSWARQAAVMAVVASAAAYTKPPGYFLGVALAAALVVAWWSRTVRGVLVAQVTLMLTINAGLLTAWNVRNFAETGYLGFSTQIERAAFLAAPAALISARSGESYDTVLARLRTPSRGGQEGAQSVREYRTRQLPMLLGSLPAYGWIHAKGSLVTLMNPAIYGWNAFLNRHMEPTLVGKTLMTQGVRESLHSLRGAPLESVLLSCLFSLWPLGCVVLWGIALWKAGGTPGIRVLSVLVVSWLLIVGGPHGDPRYRSPIVPALSVLAAIGLARGSVSVPQTPWPIGRSEK